ncbi:MAG: alpha-L-arabinofuranosidase C-terminal domain-containing protein, partial [Aristaeellaceae bacterium]
PEMKLIGSAGPDITSERYTAAWDFYKEACPKKDGFCYAVDEHYYVKPDWFYDHVHFYDNYPRNVKVFSGEYAAHPVNGMNKPEANNLEGALAEAAFLTGVERNADVVVLASYAPLFARIGYAQWSPDMIWFDEEKAYGTPSYYVQKMYGENMGTVTIPMHGQDKVLEQSHLYVNVSLDERTDEIIIKCVNHSDAAQEIELVTPVQMADSMTLQTLTCADGLDSYNTPAAPEKVSTCTAMLAYDGKLPVPANSFVVARVKRSC